MSFFGGGSTTGINYNAEYNALLKYYPQLQAEQAAAQSQYGGKAAMDSAMSQLAIQQATAPQTAQLQTDLYRQYGGQLAQIGSDIGLQTQRNQAGNNATVANSQQGQAALEAAIRADMAANPQFYSNREVASNSLNALLKSNTDALNGNLSPHCYTCD